MSRRNRRRIRQFQYPVTTLVAKIPTRHYEMLRDGGGKRHPPVGISEELRGILEEVFGDPLAPPVICLPADK